MSVPQNNIVKILAGVVLAVVLTAALMAIFTPSRKPLPEDRRGIVADIFGPSYEVPDTVVILNWTHQPELGQVTLNLQDRRANALITLTKTRLSDELFKQVRENMTFMKTVQGQTRFSKPPKPNELDLFELKPSKIGAKDVGVGYTQVLDTLGAYHPGILLVLPQNDVSSVMINAFDVGKRSKTQGKPNAVQQKDVKASVIQLIENSEIGKRLPE